MDDLALVRELELSQTEAAMEVQPGAVTDRSTIPQPTGNPLGTLKKIGKKKRKHQKLS